MKFVLYTNSVSAHQLPLAREIAKRIGKDNFRYIYTGNNLQHGSQEVSVEESWLECESEDNHNLLENCETLLVGGLRPIDLFERRLAKGLKSFYQSERWFKPIDIKLPLLLPGWLRMFVPSYRKMVNRFVKLANSDNNFKVLAIGPWAKKDFKRIGIPEEKILDWGYFVEPSNLTKVNKSKTHKTQLKILYIGRLLKLKHVDTIIHAVVRVNNKLERDYSTKNKNKVNVMLSIYGNGPEEDNLKKLVIDINKSNNLLQFFPTVSLEKVRQIMCEHDVLVFASDARDGWGAVVSEALSEGIPVIGTYETGASAALLPESQLFHSGDIRALEKIIYNIQIQTKPLMSQLPIEYSPKYAASRLLMIHNS